MSGLQAWMLSFALIGAGIGCLVWWLVPAQPDPVQALDRLAPTTHRPITTSPAAGQRGGVETRLGLWAMRRLPGALWRNPPRRDLAVMGKALHVFYGEKLVFLATAAIGIPLVASVFSVTFPMPVAVPASATLLGMFLVWFLPDGNLADAAKQARSQFRQALGSYVDLVALERNAGGAGTRAALENAARVGDSWPFRRIGDALSRSRYSGTTAWDALHEVAQEQGLADLDDLADIMRLAGEEGSQVVDTLRARSAELRHAILAEQQARANVVGERMVVPSILMALVFVAILLIAGLLRLTAG
ncbi:MAG: type II secretion system F family protein [Propionibacteriaceae bacterium]|nr:type II secretion system F family protein [Propionibacteriaceae bacterium]